MKDSRTVSSKKCSDKKTVPEEKTVKATEEGNISSKVEDLCIISQKETVPEEQVVEVSKVGSGWTKCGKKRIFDEKKEKQPVIREGHKFTCSYCNTKNLTLSKIYKHIQDCGLPEDVHSKKRALNKKSVEVG